MIVGGLSVIHKCFKSDSEWIISALPIFETKFTYCFENKGFGNAIWTNFFGEIRKEKKRQVMLVLFLRYVHLTSCLSPAFCPI
jgi:hypothetical protein